MKTNKIIALERLEIIAQLCSVLTDSYPDPDSVLSSEPQFIPIVMGRNRDIVLKALMTQIEKL